MKKVNDYILFLLLFVLNACVSVRSIQLDNYIDLNNVGDYISQDSIYQKLSLHKDGSFVLYVSDSTYNAELISHGRWHNIRSNIINLTSDKIYNDSSLLSIDCDYRYPKDSIQVYFDFSEINQTDTNYLRVNIESGLSFTKDTCFVVGEYIFKFAVFHEIDMKHTDFKSCLYQYQIIEMAVNRGSDDYTFYRIKFTDSKLPYTPIELIHENLYVSSPNKLYWRNREWVKQ